MIPFLALVRKDLRLFFGDRRAVVVGLIVPIVLASFFGYLFGGQGGQQETSRMPVLVIDQDASSISGAVVAQLSSDKNLDVNSSTLDEARTQVSSLRHVIVCHRAPVEMSWTPGVDHHWRDVIGGEAER